VIVEDLRRTGKAALTLVDAGEMFGFSMVRRELSGTITRVGPGPVAVRMLVNGRLVDLPALHATGTLSDGADAEEVELYVLDDPQNPILLRSRGPGFSSSLVRIEFPEPETAAPSIEQDLAASRAADVYGIYFAFARDDIRPQSERVLREIASVMSKHPDWRLRIDGHTDGIGNEAANLDLSRRRAAAVKRALVERYGIDPDRLTTGGYGAGSPKDRNDTPEGRAHNRRVELRRE
jgi:outer membrane protein OmpA-like peptidoglycan-associated protein